MKYTLSQLFALLRFAFKAQLEYKVNFVASMLTMVTNNTAFILIYVIFVGFFHDAWLEIADFLIVISLFTIYFGITHGLFHNIPNMGEIIETGKLDYYLSFPVSTLKLLSIHKIDATNLGDIVFGIILGGIYAFMLVDDPLRLLPRMAVVILGSLFFIGMNIIFWSISFFLDKGSEVHALWTQTITMLGSYPPAIFGVNRMVFMIVAILGIYPLMILPITLIEWAGGWYNWLIFIILCLGTFICSLIIFRYWLRRYTSGNLIHQS